MFGAVRLSKNSDQNKYSYFRYGIGFDSDSFFSFPNFDWGKYVIVFGVDNSSSVHVENKKKDILVIAQIQRLDDTSIRAKVQYSINFSRSGRKFFLILHYDENNSFSFVNATKIYQFKAKSLK